jgi:methyl-accepting chemotaxis protein
MLSIIILTIYLNQKNTKDALVVNIAGKQRMLTQKISKNIFYLHRHQQIDFNELNIAIEEFKYGLDSLKNGNKSRGITPAPTDKIAEQLAKITILWQNFEKYVQETKKLLIANDPKNKQLLEIDIDAIYKSNINLLIEVDKLVTMYTNYIESKTRQIEYFQYTGILLLCLLIIYSIQQLRIIEQHATQFLEYSKVIVEKQNENLPIEYIEIEAESEIVEATDTINCFINKINSAMDYSAQAVEKSQQASQKLEEITDEFENIINDISNSAQVSKQLNRSEDIAIQSTEDLLKTTKKLADLKEQLDSLLTACK